MVNLLHPFPPGTITGVLGCMQERAHRICDTTHKKPKLQHLQHVFQATGFPQDLVSDTLAHQPLAVTPSGSTSDEPPKILCVPYIRGLSERVCTPLGVRAAFKPMRTLTQTLMQLQNHNLEEKRKSVVYKIPCKDCGKTYIGETKRTLKVRFSEHKLSREVTPRTVSRSMLMSLTTALTGMVPQ